MGQSFCPLLWETEKVPAKAEFSIGKMTTSNSNIVVEWLRSLHLGQYAESFLDNGYDDLEICKQVGDPDLDAIGVFNPNHRLRLLHSVRTLREEGAASVYFTLEETAAVHDECMCDSSSSHTESSTGKHGSSEKDTSDRVDDKAIRVSSRNSSRSNESSKDVSGKFRDEYEEGKAELLKIPRFQLKMLLKEKLSSDGIRLSCQPYSTPSGDKGYLEGLASRYADLFNTHYCDVLEHLDEIRRKEWNELSPRICVLQSKPESPGTPPGTYSPTRQVTTASLHGLTTSLSQPIYVPGKYSPSSCLSDKEEDEIYGFAGYGIYGKQMLQRQQQRKLYAQNQVGHAQGYQTCLSPRSAYFYEFPPTDLSGTQSTKKKTTFSKFLRGLKTVHRKEKHGSSSPRHGRDSRSQGDSSNHRVGNDEGSPNRSPMLLLPPMDSKKLNYDHLRVLQLNGSASNFEETIHRLKIQDALKKKEKFHREHEEILRDIREGLNQLRKSPDDTYMYDEDVRAFAPHHWYDEPPYESDPEDFLMGLGNNQSMAALQNGRVCFTLNMRSGRQREGILSHPSAGDISIPRDTDSAPRRGLILPQYGPYPPAIIPLTHARSNRNSGDYAGTDVQSLSSRLSTFSMETTRSEQQDYYQFGSSRGKASSDQSSDYEDHELSLPIENSKSEGSSNKKKKHKKTKEKELTKIKGNLHSASSGESLPSGSGSSTQALMRETSGHSSLSPGDDRDTSSLIGPAPQGGTVVAGPVLAKARALVDCSPSHYDREALKFKKGDIIDVLQMNPSGLWQGIAHGKAGLFKFINVEILSEKTLKRLKNSKQHKKGKPKSVEELLKRISMEEYTSVFVLNGYEDVELFQDLESQDLDYLNIRDSEHRAKILTAVQLLHDYDSNNEKDEISSSGSEDGRSCSSENESPVSSTKLSKPGHSQKFLRDSGCFEEDVQNGQRKPKTNFTKTGNSSNNLDSVERNIFFKSESKKSSQKGLSNLKLHPNFGGGNSVENLEMNVFTNHSKVNYQPNIPVSDQKKNSAKDFLEQTREVLNRAKEIASNSRDILERSSCLDTNETSNAECRPTEESCEANTKLAMAKYVAGGFNDLGMHCETGNAGFSEKSSDSGVSSSSMSSANFKDRKLGAFTTTTVESPKIQRLESPKKSEKPIGKLFSGLSTDGTKKGESGNLFSKSPRNRPRENLRSSERSESKAQDLGSPNGFSNQFLNRSLIVQKKT